MRHYADDVIYDCAGFVEKNRDQINEEHHAKQYVKLIQELEKKYIIAAWGPSAAGRVAGPAGPRRGLLPARVGAVAGAGRPRRHMAPASAFVVAAGAVRPRRASPGAGSGEGPDEVRGRRGGAPKELW